MSTAAERQQGQHHGGKVRTDRNADAGTRRLRGNAFCSASSQSRALDRRGGVRQPTRGAFLPHKMQVDAACRHARWRSGVRAAKRATPFTGKHNPTHSPHLRWSVHSDVGAQNQRRPQSPRTRHDDGLSRAPALHNARALLLVLARRQPQLLEGAQGGKDGPARPRTKPALFPAGRQYLAAVRLIGQAFGTARMHGKGAGEHYAARV